MNGPLLERDRGSQVTEMSVAETAGIPGATLTKLHDGTYLVTSDAANPPRPDELRALLLEFMPGEWECYDWEATEDYDLAYYGPADWSPDECTVPVPRPRGHDCP